MAETREARLKKRAAAAGYRVEKDDLGYRMVDASTGTLAAADWTAPGGYGIDLDLVEQVLDGTYVYTPPASVWTTTVTSADVEPELTRAEMDAELRRTAARVRRAK